MEVTEVIGKQSFRFEGAIVVTVLFSIIGLAFSTGVEFERIANIQLHQMDQDTNNKITREQVLELQTTLPVQMAAIQAKLDDIRSRLKESQGAN